MVLRAPTGCKMVTELDNNNINISNNTNNINDIDN